MAGNIVMFIPLGFFLPCLWVRLRSFGQVDHGLEVILERMAQGLAARLQDGHRFRFRHRALTLRIGTRFVRYTISYRTKKPAPDRWEAGTRITADCAGKRPSQSFAERNWNHGRFRAARQESTTKSSSRSQHRASLPRPWSAQGTIRKKTPNAKRKSTPSTNPIRTTRSVPCIRTCLSCERNGWKDTRTQ